MSLNSSETLAIKSVNLTKIYGGKKAVNGVSLSIKKGEIYGFLGPNGAGKSTIIRMLVTLSEPSSGDAWILGSSVTKQEGDVRLKIGVALQDAALDESQKGIELLRLQANLYGLRGKDVTQRLEDLTKLVDIGDAINKPIKTYSGGMKRRLDLAAALVHNPKVLFLDEPTTGLDPVSRSRVWDEIKRLNKDLGMTIFLTTQYLEEADQLCDRVGIIAGGLLKAEGTPKELKALIGNDIVTVSVSSLKESINARLKAMKSVKKVEQEKSTLKVYMKEASKNIGELVEAITSDGSTVLELSIRIPSLDDVFLQVTGLRLKGDD
ncbi:MAG: ATP-binding cassette domain-containing protein [Candidatus Saccharibacteria bacterium]